MSEQPPESANVIAIRNQREMLRVIARRLFELPLDDLEELGNEYDEDGLESALIDAVLARRRRMELHPGGEE